MASDTMVVVRTTFDNEDAARQIARRLVEEGLAACVHHVPVRSSYRWNGAVREDDEHMLEARTTPARAAELRKRILSLHTYEIPLIEVFEVHGVPPAYLDWAAHGTKGKLEK